MLKAAILGCGGIANAHARVLTSLSGQIQLIAFCDVVEERAAGFNERYAQNQATVFTDMKQMYDEADLDVVYICLPPFAHSEEVMLAAERGIHVFIEKPIALNMDLANKMVEAVEQHGIKSQVGFMSRFGEAVEYVKGSLDSGKAGPVGLMIGKYMCNSLHSPWWREREKSGGQIVEQIIHTYDIVRYLLGDIDTVFCRMDNIFHQSVERYTSEDVSATVITFKNGAVASVTGTNGGIPGQWISSYELVAKNITVQFANANQAKVLHTDASPVEEEAISGDTDLMKAETLDLLRAIETDGQTRTPMIEGAKTLELVLAATQSGMTGKIVELA